jgi:hypothetical protein
MVTSFIACILLLLSIVLRGVLCNVLWLLALVCLGGSYFRIFSRNLYRRQQENQRFLQRVAPITGWWERRRQKRRQRNLYCFFKCPQCNTVLRVPKGKGHIRITCKNCHHIFERNS